MQVQYLVKLLSYASLLHPDTFSVYLIKKEQTKEREIKKTKNEEKKKKERKKKEKKKRRERVLEHAATKDNVLFQDQWSPPAVYQRKNEKQNKTKKPRESLSHYIFSSNIYVSSEVGSLFWNATKVIGIARQHRKMLS